MIKAGLIFLGLLLAGAVQAEMHEFKLPDGRSIKAEIQSYNGKINQVELKLENGSRKKIDPSIFVAADQAYIKDWAKMEGFSSPSSFKVSCKKDLIEKWKEEEEGDIRYPDGSTEKETISETKFEKVIYEVQLENRNDVALENLTFEYRIYYEQGTASGSGKKRGDAVVAQQNLPGEFKITRLSPKAKTTMKTNPVVIHETEYVGDFIYSGGDPVKEQGDVIGIWIQIKAKTPGGETVTRHVYEPSNIEGKYAW